MPATLTWYGQAAFLLRSEAVSLIIDPYFSNSCADQGFIRLYAPPVRKGELAVDYVLSTHDHGDHLDIETLEDYLGWKHFIGPSSCTARLEREGFPAEKLRPLNRGGRIKAGDITLSAVHAEHTADSIGVIAEIMGKRLYFSGDTLMNPGLFSIAEERPDAGFLCINGKFGNMTWQEAVVFAHTLKLKAAYPCHYDLFAVNAEDPAFFAAAFQGSPIKGGILERGRAYGLEEIFS
ncbi:MAG: MBL fold metallo-hydrolase [Treponema sp.]|jgi:L-ascorbate 6-phosphate lactonase|nr:MBL fold metallo-hydrolase [Treponema sp.]